MVTKLHEILNRDDTLLGRASNWLISVLIVLSILLLCLETFDLTESSLRILGLAETILIVIFTLEWLLRLSTAKLQYPESSTSVAMKRFVLSPYSIVDLFAILPFYLALVFPLEASALMTLRAFRLVRLLKLGRYSKSLQVITNVFIRKRGELLVTAYISTLILFIISILMYYAEHEAQPQVFVNVLDGLWWGIATLTTVGYGDIYPITTLGKIIAAVSAFIGIGVFALPTAILGSAFLEEIQNE